jgi:hypothetical protein
VLQTAQRIGLAIGQAVIGAVFFANLGGPGTTAERYADGLRAAILAALAFVALAAAVGGIDLVRNRRRSTARA